MTQDDFELQGYYITKLILLRCDFDFKIFLGPMRRYILIV